MNQKLWKNWLDHIFAGNGYVVIENKKDGGRDVYVCRENSAKRLIRVWPNKDLYNVVLQREVKACLDEIGFKYNVEPIVEGNRYDYRSVSEAHVLSICKKYMECVNGI